MICVRKTEEKRASCTLPSNSATSPYIPARGNEFWQSRAGEPYKVTVRQAVKVG